MIADGHEQGFQESPEPVDRTYNGLSIAFWLAQLTPETTVGELPLHDVVISDTASGREVAHQFRQKLKLSGLILTSGKRLLGVISRQKFLEYLCWKRGAIDTLDRSISSCLEPLVAVGAICLTHNLLQLLHTCPVDEAVAQALSRLKSCVNDPLLIFPEDGHPRLLNFHDLTLAQAHITQLRDHKVQQRRHELGKCREKILQQWQDVERAQQHLDARHTLLNHREQFLERQRNELMQQMEQTQQLRRRLEHIEQTLSEEGTGILQTLLGTTQSISSRNHRTATISKALSKELEAVQRAARLVKQLGKQVHFVGVRSAVLANRFGAQIHGFNHLAVDIRELSQQTLETSKGMEEIANLLRSYIADLAVLTQEGNSALQTSVQQTTRLEELLRSLHESLKPEEPSAPPPSSTVTWINPRFRAYINNLEDHA